MATANARGAWAAIRWERASRHGERSAVRLRPSPWRWSPANCCTSVRLIQSRIHADHVDASTLARRHCIFRMTVNSCSASRSADRDRRACPPAASCGSGPSGRNRSSTVLPAMPRVVGRLKGNRSKVAYPERVHSDIVAHVMWCGVDESRAADETARTVRHTLQGERFSRVSRSRPMMA